MSICRARPRRTFSRVGQVGHGLGHDDGDVDCTVGVVHAKLEEDVVEDVLHDIPVADDAGAGLEGVSDVASGRRVGVAVVAGKGEGLSELSVPVLGHDGGDAEARGRLERPAGSHGRGACGRGVRLCLRLGVSVSRAALPLSMTMAAVSGFSRARLRPSSCGSMYFSNRVSLTGKM